MSNNAPKEAPVNRRLLIIAVVLAAVAAVAATGLLVNVFEHRQEAKTPFYKTVELNDKIDDPKTWGMDFPMQYSLYLRTRQEQATKYGGDEPQLRSPVPEDPRPTVARSNLDKDPRLKVFWAGYAFSKDYRERRGHEWMLADQTYTGRQKVKQPGTCINCHASMYIAYKQAGDGDLQHRGVSAECAVGSALRLLIPDHRAAGVAVEDPLDSIIRISMGHTGWESFSCFFPPVLDVDLDPRHIAVINTQLLINRPESARELLRGAVTP